METQTDTQFDERLRMAKEIWEVERQSMLNQIHQLRCSTGRQELSSEIAQTEAALIQVQGSIEAMAGNPNTVISKLVQATARELELQAYLKGLRFTATVQNK